MQNKPLPKHKYLKLLVEHGQSLGFNHFTIFINDEETEVILRGHNGSEEKFDRVLHRIHKHKNDGDGLRGIYARRDRLHEWLGKYDHWLDWVFLVQKKENANEK